MNRILVADDDSNFILALSHRLTSAGYDVLTAKDGLEAMELALEERPDLLLLDVCMTPGFGLSVAERLRALHITTPIIFLTGSSDSQVVRAARRIGHAHYLEKPYEPSHLLALASAALANSKPVQTHHNSFHSHETHSDRR